MDELERNSTFLLRDIALPRGGMRYRGYESIKLCWVEAPNPALRIVLLIDSVFRGALSSLQNYEFAQLTAFRNVGMLDATPSSQPQARSS